MRTRFFILVLGVFLNLEPAQAQSFTIWGVLHETMVDKPDPCQVQHQVLLDRNPKQIKVPNFIYVNGEFTTNQENKSIQGAEDKNVHAYIDLYGATLALVSEGYEGFQGIRKISIQDYMQYLSTYFEILYSTPTLSEITNRVINTTLKEEYPLSFQSDYDQIKRHQMDIQPGPGLTHFLKEFFTRSPDGTLDKVQPILKAYLRLSREIATQLFNQTIKTNEKKYNVILDMPGSYYDENKIFDVIFPEKLFSENFMFSFPRTPAQYQMKEVLMLFWRDEYIFENIVSRIKNISNSNVLLWIGDQHVPDLANRLVKTNQLTQAQKNLIKIISVQSDEKVACDADAVLNSISSKNSKSLVEWNSKYGFHELPDVLTIFSKDGKIVYRNRDYRSKGSGEDVFLEEMVAILRTKRPPGDCYKVLVELKSQKINRGYEICLE